MAKRSVEFDIIATDKASKTVASADASLAKLDKSAAATSKTLTSHGAALDAVKGKLSGFASQIPGGSKALDMLGGSAEGAGASLGAMVGPAAAGAVLGFAAKGVEAFQNLGGEVLKFQRVTQISAEESSKFVEVMHDYNIEADAGSASMGKLAKNASGGAAGLAAVGVEVAKNANGTVNLEATLGNVANAYASTTDATKRAAIGTAAFGKSWQSMAPILEKGAAGVKEALDGVASSKILNQSDLRNAEEFRLALDDIRDAGEGLMIQIGKGLVPALKDGTKATAEFVGILDKATHPVGGLSNVVGVLADSLNPLTPIMKAFGQQSEENAKQADLFMKAVNAANVATTAVDPIIEGVTASMKGNKQAAADNAKQMADLAKQLDALDRGYKAVLQSTKDVYLANHVDMPAALDNVRSSLLSYYDTLKNTNDALKTHSAASKEGQLATIALDDAGRSLTTSFVTYAEKAGKAAEAQATMNGASFDATDSAVAQRQALVDLEGQFPELKANIDDYIKTTLDPLITRTGAAGDATAAAASQAALAAQAFDRAITSADAAARHAGEAAATVASSSGGGGGVVLHRASGGPVSAGSPYVVGEVGPELFVPKTAGMIVPNNALGGSTSITIYAIDAKGVIDALAKAKRQNPALFAQLVA